MRFSPSTPGFDSRHSQNFYFDVVKIYCLWLEESGQRLDKVDRTHLVLASLYYKKDCSSPISKRSP